MNLDKPTILFADDEANICRIAKILLEPHQYQVITAENGIDAYEKILKFNPDIIFSDILMPKCDGFELCQKIKENEQVSSIPFIFLTALEEKQFKERFESVNANDYLTKPFTSEDLLGKINLWYNDKPVIHSEDVINITQETPETNAPILFGNKDIDESLKNLSLSYNSNLLINGAMNSGQTESSFDFLLEGIKQNQHVAFISLSKVNKQNHELLNMTEPKNQLLHFIDASDWTSIDALPWRSLDFIYDAMFDLCSQFKISRIVVDQFSMGYPFWNLPETLSFINQCRSLPNYENQLLLFTVNNHSSIDQFNFNIAQAMDVVISSETTKAETATNPIETNIV